jgi:hypothetical protein
MDEAMTEESPVDRMSRGRPVIDGSSRAAVSFDMTRFLRLAS